MLAIRNIATHDLRNPTESEALQQLAALSLLAAYAVAAIGRLHLATVLALLHRVPPDQPDENADIAELLADISAASFGDAREYG
jgi:hypothetical protein